MDPSSPPPYPGQKKGLSGLAWLGIGCGGLILLTIVGFVVAVFFVGGKVVQFGKEAQANPTRAAASIMVTAGVATMIAEDDVNKRYTVREKQSGKLTTFYWDAKTNSVASVDGDFSAIPVQRGETEAPPPPTEPERTAVPAER
jgi:hypothetical protein